MVDSFCLFRLIGVFSVDAVKTIAIFVPKLSLDSSEKNDKQ